MIGLETGTDSPKSALTMYKGPKIFFVFFWQTPLKVRSIVTLDRMYKGTDF